MRKTLIAALLAGASFSTMASDFNYNYVEAGFADYDGFDSGLQIGGSYKIDDKFFVSGSFLFSDFDVMKVGVGYIIQSDKKFDFYAQLSFVKVEFDIPDIIITIPPNPPITISGSLSDDGFELTGGVRYQIDSKFEVGGGLNHFVADNSDTSLFLYGLYKLNKEFDVSARLNTGDFESIMLSARYNF